MHRIGTRLAESSGVQRSHLVAALAQLIETCRDGHAGYRIAAKSVGDPEIEELLGKFSRQRKQFAEELQEEVERLGGTVAQDHGSVGGALHRGWLKLREELGHPSRFEILTECARGEAVSIRHYKEVLQQELPPMTREMLATHLERIIAAKDHVHVLKRDKD